MRIQNALFSLIALLPIVGCAASTQDDASSQSDPLSFPIGGIGGVVKRYPPPSAPALYEVTPFPTSVTIQWVSPDASMNEFIVYRRDANWAWQAVHTEANTPGKSYAWVDTDRSLSAQCYMVTAIGNLGLGS